MTDVKATRRYSSAVREEQAARTKERILEAAGTLFTERGYGRTTTKGAPTGAPFVVRT